MAQVKRDTLVESAPAPGQSVEDFEYQTMLAKKRMMGNIRFIGELFKVAMLPGPIVSNCLKELLDSGNTDENTIECLCRLIETTGQTLFAQKFAPEETIFKKLGVLSQDRVRVVARLRFMIQDLIDLRGNGWNGRKKDAGPTTIKDVHQKVEEDRRNAEDLTNATLSGRPLPAAIPAMAVAAANSASNEAIKAAAAKAAAAAAATVSAAPTAASGRPPGERGSRGGPGGSQIPSGLPSRQSLPGQPPANRTSNSGPGYRNSGGAPPQRNSNSGNHQNKARVMNLRILFLIGIAV